MKTHFAIALSALLGLALLGCSESASSGSDEPVRIFRKDGKTAAQFFSGPPPTGASKDTGTTTPSEIEGDAGTALALPEAWLSTFPRLVFAGQRASKAAGRLSTNASAIALAFDTGSGYWVLPAGDPDFSNNEELFWDASCDYSPDVAPGNHKFTMLPIRSDGVFGAPLVKDICISGRTPDNLNACESTLAPPMTVIGLSWDTNVDLDLQVVPPTADRIVSSKHPTTVDRNANGTLPDEAGVIDRDSNAACAIDGIRNENLVFEKVKPDGVWGIYVNLFDSCKQAVVHFTVSIHVAKSDGVNDAGTALYHLEQVGLRQGMLMATQANGDSSALGTYLFEVSF